MQKMILPLFFSVGYSVKFLNFDRLHEFKMCIQLKESPPLSETFFSQCKFVKIHLTPLNCLSRSAQKILTK